MEININKLIKECEGITEKDTEEQQIRANRQLKEMVNK